MLGPGMKFKDGAMGQRQILKPNLELASKKIGQRSYNESGILGCLEMEASNYTSDGVNVEKHCCASALVGADFKAADADMADATAGSFHPPPPPPPFPRHSAAAALPLSLPRKQTQSGKLNI